jgi:hypothetical protein
MDTILTKIVLPFPIDFKKIPLNPAITLIHKFGAVSLS